MAQKIPANNESVRQGAKEAEPWWLLATLTNGHREIGFDVAGQKLYSVPMSEVNTKCLNQDPKFDMVSPGKLSDGLPRVGVGPLFMRPGVMRAWRSLAACVLLQSIEDWEAGVTGQRPLGVFGEGEAVKAIASAYNFLFAAPETAWGGSRHRWTEMSGLNPFAVDDRLAEWRGDPQRVVGAIRSLRLEIMGRPRGRKVGQ